MRIATWNVNGIRSMLKKNKNGEKHNTYIEENVIETFLRETAPDILCLQEIKCNGDKVVDEINTYIKTNTHGYIIDVNCAQKKGYSGVCIVSKLKPLRTLYSFEGIDINNMQHKKELMGLLQEGRILIQEYEYFFLINVYTPNSKEDLSRLKVRTQIWDEYFKRYISYLQTKKNVVVCGDLNVAHTDIDVHNPKSAKGKHGFTKEERETFEDMLVKVPLIDTFRVINPDIRKFSWFSPRSKDKTMSKGWRIDYILISSILHSSIHNADILHEYKGSDHYPCLVDLNF